MISEATKPRTKDELARAIQRMAVTQFEIIEPFQPDNAEDVIACAEELAELSGNVTVILVSST